MFKEKRVIIMKLPSYKEARSRKKEKVVIEEYKMPKSINKMGHNKTYYVKTYGCQMNEHDSENIKAMLEELGFIESLDMESSDLIILNISSGESEASIVQKRLFSREEI